jgi:hypothetical protein
MAATTKKRGSPAQKPGWDSSPAHKPSKHPQGKIRSPAAPAPKRSPAPLKMSPSLSGKDALPHFKGPARAAEPSPGAGPAANPSLARLPAAAKPGWVGRQGSGDPRQALSKPRPAKPATPPRVHTPQRPKPDTEATRQQQEKQEAGWHDLAPTSRYQPSRLLSKK